MKRTLALVLALVMAIGLMAFPVSADFTDDADIKYTEAVDVMSAIGVIDGFEDGSFDPDGYLTREQAAKVVAYLMLGADDADALTASSAPFDDVAANRWSAGYIAYCVNEGIINGRSATTFDPTGNVTGYEFAKLMLGCLGYDGAIEKYTGATWNINVAKTALTVGLFTGNKGANYNVPLTREEAALYAFNMLQADLVDYDNRGSEIDLGNGMTINTGASKAEPITTANESSSIKDEVGSKTEDNAVWTVQFAERYFEDLEKNTGDNDAFGRPSTEWTYDRDDIGTYSDTADFTYTTGTKGKDIYSDLNKPSASKTEYNYYVDGKEVSDIGTYYEDFAIASGNDDKIGGNGTLIEVYEVDPSDNDKYDEAYNVVVINTYVGQIAEWTEADEDDDQEEAVSVSILTDPLINDSIDPDFETTKFDEDDADDETVVICTIAWNEDAGTDGEYELKSVDAADSVTAFISRTTGSSSFVAGGETYKYSEMKYNTATYDKDADDAVIYFDNYGYVIFIDTDATSSDDYAYVLDVALDKGDIWGSKGTPYAKLVLESGEMVVVETDELYDKNDPADEDIFDAHGMVVTYDVDRDGVYTLTEATGSWQNNATDFELKKGVSKIELSSSKNVYANSKTVFVIAEYDSGDEDDFDKWDFTVYTGIANVPSMDSATKVVTDVSGTKAANFIYIEAPSNAATSDDIVYVAYDKNAVGDIIKGDDYDDHIVLNAIVDNEIVELMIAADDDAYDAIVAAKADVSYKSVKYDSDGLVTSFGAALTPAATADETKRIEDDALEVDGEYFTLDEDCEVFIVEDGEITAGTANSIRNSSTTGISVYTNSDGFVTTVVLTK